MPDRCACCWTGSRPAALVRLPVHRAGHQAGRPPLGEAAHSLARLGNVVLLERPINAETLTSAAASALRARRRQYQARGLLRSAEHADESCAAERNLEQRVEERARELRPYPRNAGFRAGQPPAWDRGTSICCRTSPAARRSTTNLRLCATAAALEPRGLSAPCHRRRPRPRFASFRAGRPAAARWIWNAGSGRPDGAVRWIRHAGASASMPHWHAGAHGRRSSWTPPTAAKPRSAAPGAEDGGDRPAHRRRRP